jgi:dTDP-4-dehydrorhamnose 3,5-epimerase
MKSNHPTFEDDRGSFTAIDSKYLGKNWNQFNVGVNKNKFTFRGLHYQTNPPQTKCIKVIKGKIIDMWLDLKTKEVFKFELDNNEILYIPDNYAHGYLTLKPDTVVSYLVEGEYNPNSEHSIVWNEVPEVKKIIDSYLQGCTLWISDKDREGK